MKRGVIAVLLDSGPLGLASSPARTVGALECQERVASLHPSDVLHLSRFVSAREWHDISP